VRVVVVGGGIAGTAAAWTAARRGARVTLVSAGSGASVLATGALDHELHPRHEAGGALAVDAGALDVVRALGAFVVPEARGVLLATTAGVVRPARGHDAALLDWTRLAGMRVGVVRARRPGWDADALARCWSGKQEAVPIEAAILRLADERVLPDGDFAARHDDDARLAWLGDRLREALVHSPAVSALVLPPCLGVEHARAEALSTRIGLPCGEASALPGGPSGLRFQHARDRALGAAEVERVAAHVTAVERSSGGWSVEFEGARGLEADVVVFATGGLLGGGIEYASSEWLPAAELPSSARVPFRFTVSCEALRMGARGRPTKHPGSLFGAPPESLAWPFARDPVMDRMGALADGEGRVEEGLFVAGEVVADLPHAWLSALESGARAGAAVWKRAAEGRGEGVEASARA
jgi:glycerol-3-phosphate dehydrogenase subunit B